MTLRGEVVGTDVLERALEGPAERRAGGRDDDGFGHGGSPGDCIDGPRGGATGD